MPSQDPAQSRDAVTGAASQCRPPPESHLTRSCPADFYFIHIYWFTLFVRMVPLEKMDAELEKTLKAVANKRRLAILHALQNNKKGISVGTIAGQIKLSFRSTSKHLAILYGTGLLEREQKSTLMFYIITPKGSKTFATLSSL